MATKIQTLAYAVWQSLEMVSMLKTILLRIRYQAYRKLFLERKKFLGVF